MPTGQVRGKKKMCPIEMMQKEPSKAVVAKKAEVMF